MRHPRFFLVALSVASFPSILNAQGGVALSGTWRGAFIRGGSVQLLDAELIVRNDTLLVLMSSPDRPAGRAQARVQRDSAGRVVFGTWHGPARLSFDSAGGEMAGSVGNGTGTTLHLRRMAMAPRVEVVREEVAFTSAGANIAASIVRPVGIPIHAAIVRVQGRGCGTREGEARWLETLAQYGIAGIATDKRGTGRSGGSCLHGTIDELTADAIAAMAELRRRVTGDGIRYGFWGNSAGGWVSTRAAARTPTDFLIMSAGPSTSVKQQQTDNVTLVTRRLNVDSAGTARMLRYIDLMFATGATQQRYDEMMASVAWARTNGVANQFFETSDIPTSVAGLDSLWVVHNRYDPGPDLSRLTIPILAFYGGSDEVVPPESNVPLLRRYAAAAGNDRVRIVVVPDGDHGLNQPPGSHAFTAGGGEYWRFPRTSAQVLDEALRFLRAR